jgi:L-lactate dehydrogenase complex protein LldF
VARIAHDAGTTEVVKVKSMATQEIELNEALRLEGIDVWETDLAEMIVQLGHDLPSHILVPGDPSQPDRDPRHLQGRDGPGRAPGAARPERRSGGARRGGPAATSARSSFRARVGVSGANFAVAETGTVMVVESEGNGRMCVTLPEVLVTVMGIEKLVPTWADLGGLPAALPALVDRRADEPVHVDVDRRDAGRRPAGLPPDPARQRTDRTCCSTRPGDRRCAASAARPV